MTPVNFRLAIVGGATLKGRELADVLSSQGPFPAHDVRLLDDDEALGRLEAVGDELTFVQRVNAEQFEHVDAAFFASEESFTRRTWGMARAAGAAVIDLSYGLEEAPGAVVRAPWVESELPRPPAPFRPSAPVIVAHPAAVVLALLLLRARKAARLRTAVATVVEPASERGRPGMDELHEQTVSLLSFRELPRQVFGAQVAFNLTTRCGDHSPSPLEVIERRISRHFGEITSGVIPPPALLLLQGPTFHGHAFAVYAELEEAIPAGALAEALQGEHVSLAEAGAEAPSNVNSAGLDHMVVAVRRDRHHARGYWLWAAADNLRLMALNAAECAASLAPGPPEGKAQ
jgi:aspartate-semialdehyde dehydrogenase